MCPDGSSDITASHSDNVVFIKNSKEVTCADFQAYIASSYSKSMDVCAFAHFLGEEVCGCSPIGAFCHICGDTNPSPEALNNEILPGAYCLRQDDPSGIFARLCPAFSSIGTYCGCDISPNGPTFCRLCGGSNVTLPGPSRLVNSSLLGLVTTCFHVEFASNMNNTGTKE